MNKGELNEKKSDFAFLLQLLTNTKFGKKSLPSFPQALSLSLNP
jgi:hypothetical protein